MSHLSLPPQNEEALLEKAKALSGLTFAQLASRVHLNFSDKATQRKGWVGQALEMALGANAKNKAAPDFMHLGIELKTMPINSQGKPCESTYITNIPLLKIHQESWENSQCYHKLKKILWICVEGDKTISFPNRRIIQPILWSPSNEQLAILKADWVEITNLIIYGKISDVGSDIGTYLQIRPKGANAKSLCDGFNEQGDKIKTLPRGFYLRPAFTQKIITEHLFK